MYLLQWSALCALCAAAAGALDAEGTVDVEGTVRRVQALLRDNSLLPRLSRREILDLLADIRAEDAGAAPRPPAPTTPRSALRSEASPGPGRGFDSSTERDEPSMLVVLPYTPRDGHSLQELYTKAPRVQRVPLAGAGGPRGAGGARLRDALEHNARRAHGARREGLPEGLRAFLEAHGLEGGAGVDHFLLPPEGFKPLPPARALGGRLRLPEDFLLTYEPTSASGAGAGTAHNFLSEPLGPREPALEPDASSSETRETVYPLPMPGAPAEGALLPLHLDPIDYDAVKVIPLNAGVSPVQEVKVPSGSEQSKRQANGTEEATTGREPATTEDGKSADGTTTAAPAAGDSGDSAGDSAASAANESGASLADLESSFGGALPAEPGDAELPPPRKNGFYWMVDWNSFLEVGDGDSKVNIRFEPKLGDPQMFLPVSVP